MDWMKVLVLVFVGLLALDGVGVEAVTPKGLTGTKGKPIAPSYPATYTGNLHLHQLKVAPVVDGKARSLPDNGTPLQPAHIQGLDETYCKGCKIDETASEEEEEQEKGVEMKNSEPEELRFKQTVTSHHPIKGKLTIVHNRNYLNSVRHRGGRLYTGKAKALKALLKETEKQHDRELKKDTRIINHGKGTPTHATSSSQKSTPNQEREAPDEEDEDAPDKERENPEDSEEREEPPEEREAKQEFKASIHFRNGYHRYLLFDYGSSSAGSKSVNAGGFTEEWKNFPEEYSELRQALQEKGIDNGQLRSQMHSFYVAGYASNAGDAAKNHLLSNNRAKSVACYVANWLKRAGVSSYEFHIGYFGEAQSFGTSAEGQAKDRRVDIFFAENFELKGKVVTQYKWTHNSKGEMSAELNKLCFQSTGWRYSSSPYWSDSWLSYQA